MNGLAVFALVGAVSLMGSAFILWVLLTVAGDLAALLGLFL